MPKTADGVELIVGMTVWVWDNELHVPRQHQVGTIYERKIVYAAPTDPDDYIGARLDVVFADETTCIVDEEKRRATCTMNWSRFASKQRRV